MFTVLSNTRSANLYLIVVLAIMAIVLTIFTVAPSIAAPKPAIIPVTGGSEWPDYFQRHPKLSAPAEIVVDTSDYFFRHSELDISTESIDLTDYFLRHR